MLANKILEEDPLFSEYKIDLELIESLLNFRGSIDSYCPKCKKNSVFQSVEGGGSKQQKNEVIPEFILKRPKIIHIELKCSRNLNHLGFVTLLQTSNKLIKAGQYPSTGDNLKCDIQQFRKDFPQDYKELRRAYGLSDHNVGIGAFTYLRRIFERRLESAAIRKDKTSKDWDKDSLNELRIGEKIDELSDQLPTFLVENKPVYGILSKGIHELTEDECLKYFSVLSKSIELLLEQELEIIQKEKLEQDLSSEINKINQEISN